MIFAISTYFKDALPGKGDQMWILIGPRRSEKDPIRSVLTSLLLDDFNIENGTTRVVPDHINGLRHLLKGLFLSRSPRSKIYNCAKRNNVNL